MKHNTKKNNWLIVFFAFYTVCVHTGCFIYAFSLFTTPLQASFGWERSTIMIAFSLLMLSTGLASPFIGGIVDKFGARRIIPASALISALSIFSLILAKSPLHFYISYILLGIFGTAMGPLTATYLVSESFTEKRGIAIGFASTGVGIGALSIAPLIGGYIIPNFGWKMGYIVMAVLIFSVIPFTLLIIKSRPHVIYKHTKIANNIDDDNFLKRALVSVPFILISLAFFLNLFGLMSLTQSQVPYLQDIGFPLPTAASMIGVVGLVSAFSKLFFGWICDKIKPKYALTIGSTASVTGILILMIIKPESSPLMMWLFPVLIGFGVGSWLPVMSMTVSSTFPIVYYGVIFGFVSLAQNVGASIGPLVAAYINEMTGSYYWAFIVIIVSYLLSIIAILSVKPYEPKFVSETERQMALQEG
jgi:MFS family permease